jgi:hypothetical protein
MSRVADCGWAPPLSIPCPPCARCGSPTLPPGVLSEVAERLVRSLRSHAGTPTTLDDQAAAYVLAVSLPCFAGRCRRAGAGGGHA